MIDNDSETVSNVEIAEVWKEFTDVVVTTVSNYKSVTNEQIIRKPWISEETMNLIVRRSEFKAKLMNVEIPTEVQRLQLRLLRKSDRQLQI